MTKEDGIKLLEQIIYDEVVHQDYKRVTELAEKYYKLKTGDGIEDFLRQIETRVTDEEFAQIKKIYNSIVPATLSSSKLQYQKGVRSKPRIREILIGGDKENEKTDLEKYISTFWGNKSLEDYLEYAVIDYNYIDPNAFLITEFGDFNFRIEKAKPYPFIASSAESIMFEYNNEILEYLVVKLPIKYMDGPVEKVGEKFTMYLGMDTIVYSQVANKEGAVMIRNKFYEVTFFQPKNDKVPAVRFGYIRDEQTKGRTFVSVFDHVMGYLKKTIKIDSELDLSSAMVAFPQRYRYVTPCRNLGCNKGYMPDGNACTVCQGTGVQPFHKGTQDIVKLALPKNPEEIIGLEQLAYDHSPDINLLTWQKEFIIWLRDTIYLMMFNKELITREELTNTATVATLTYDNLYDTLYPFNQQYSAIWESVVKDIATFTDFGDVEVQHEFDRDLKFKTVPELMNDLEVAKRAGASTSTISKIEDDINEKLYFDQPDVLKEMRIKNKINPFRGYSEANIRFIISQGNAPKSSIVLWENLESIFQDLETENPELYDLAYDLIVTKVKAKTQEYIEMITGEQDEEMEKMAEQQQPFNNQ